LDIALYSLGLGDESLVEKIKSESAKEITWISINISILYFTPLKALCLEVMFIANINASSGQRLSFPFPFFSYYS